jgi:DNA (cytosine-5)-methyltransferase 1
MIAYGITSINSNSMLSDDPHSGFYVADSSRTLDTSGGSPCCNQGGMLIVGDTPPTHPDVAGTLVASGAGLSRTAGMASESDRCVAYALQGNMIGRQEHNGPRGSGVSRDLSFTLTASDPPGVAAAVSPEYEDSAGLICSRESCYTGTGFGGLCEGVGTLRANGGDIGGGSETLVASVDCRNLYENDELCGTLASKETSGYSLNYIPPVRRGYIVRRLTPTECERLQGFPDGYTAFGHDGQVISDTRRYQMLGNSVAIPCVRFVLGNIAARIIEDRKVGDGDAVCPCAS